MNTDISTLQRLSILETIEQHIVELLSVAVDTIDIISSNTSEQDLSVLETKIEERSQRYYQLLETIQVMLRQQFRHLTEMGMTDANIIFRSQVAGEEKDCAQWRAALVQLCQAIHQTRQILYDG
jgi:hypothetical protein